MGSYEIPLNAIKQGSYQSSPDQRQDYDGYRDADGKMHRNALDHTASKIEFETVPMSFTDFRNFMDNIVANYTNVKERKVSLTYYNEESGTYTTGDFYLPGTITVTWINIVLIDSCRFAFIEY